MSDKNENIENALDALYSKKMEKTVDNEVVDSSFDDNNNGNINTMKNLEDKIDAVKDVEVDDSPNEDLFPKDLQNHELEKRYIGLLLNEIKAISMYYYKYEECYFTDEQLLNIYKKIIFTDGEKYAPKEAKEGFTFSRESRELYEEKNILMTEYKNSQYKLDETYKELKKLFILRKNYLSIPVKAIQAKVAGIIHYELYNEMSPEDVQDAVNQVTSTEKFKRAVLNNDLTDFLIEGDNTLTNGLSLPFPILTKVFKGIRQGETAAFSMPSNYGKSRFTINLAAYVSLVHQKKVLIISNEMSEEKMKLCLITTILNNPDIQKLHGKTLHVSENQLLNFQFRADDRNKVETDENGFVLKMENESQVDFIKRLREVSTEFNDVLKVTNWFSGNL